MRNLLVLIFFLPLVSIAQTYSEVVEIPEKSAIQLYGDAIEWFVTDFSSEENMVLLEDPVSCKIIGKGAIDIPDSSGQRLYFKIRILFKDGKYKFEVFNITVNNGERETSINKYLEKREYYQKSSDWEWIIKNPSNGTPILRSEAKSIAQENKKISSLIDKTESGIKNLMSIFRTHMKKNEGNW